MEKEKPKKISKTSLNKTLRIFSYIGDYKIAFIIGLVCLFFTGAVALLFPRLLGNLIDSIDNVNGHIIKNAGIQIAILLLAQSFFSFFRIYLFAQVAENIFVKIRAELFSKLVSLPMQFFSQNRIGELESRLSTDIIIIQDTFTTTIAELVRQMMLLIGGIIWIFFISFKLTLFMLAVFPVIIIGAIFFGRFIRKNTKAVQQSMADANIVVQESLQGIINVKTFTNEWFEISRYLKSLNTAKTLSIKTALYRSYFASFIIFCVFGSIVAIVWYALTLVKNGELSGANMTAFVIYTTFIGASIGGLSELYAQLQKAIGATERVFELIDTPSEKINTESQTTLHNQRLCGDIEINQLSFNYPSRPDISVLDRKSVV